MTAREQAMLAATVGWRLCPHARQVAAARGFQVRDVLLAIADPEVTYTAYDYGPGRVVHQRSHLAVVVAPGTSTVITVLLRGSDDWTDRDARRANQPPPGRRPAGTMQLAAVRMAMAG